MSAPQPSPHQFFRPAVVLTKLPRPSRVGHERSLSNKKKMRMFLSAKFEAGLTLSWLFGKDHEHRAVAPSPRRRGQGGGRAFFIQTDSISSGEIELALILTFSPGEKELRSTISAFANGCPATPASRHFKKVANDSPSPWGRGYHTGRSFISSCKKVARRSFLASKYSPRTGVHGAKRGSMRH
jgi:hypothetical protein